MTDEVKESGAKWWLRYIVVPVIAALIGGGGIVAIMDHRSNSSSDLIQRAKPDISSPPPSQPIGNPAAVDPKAGGLQKDQTKPDAQQNPVEAFYAKEPNGFIIPGSNSVTFGFGSHWEIYWKVNPSLLNGTLTFNIRSDRGAESRSVILEGNRQYTCPDEDDVHRTNEPIIAELVQVANDETRRNIGTLYIHCGFDK